MRYMKWGLAATAAAVLVACGGGGSNDGGPKVNISSVKVFGDSLADSGTFQVPIPNTTMFFGVKATVQNASNLQAGYPVWPELVAKSYGLAACAHFNVDTTTGALAEKATCSNFAVGGGRVNGKVANPVITSIPFQMQAASSAGYSANDLVLIDGGGNDAADLVTAFLGISAANAGKPFIDLVGTVLPPATIGAVLGATPGTAEFAKLGGAYMQALAAQFVNDITTNVTAKGATRVALLNAPDVTGTPRFKGVLGVVAATQGQATADAVKGIAGQWTQAFNVELANKAAANSAIAIVDFYASFNDELANPQSYSLTNVTTPVCQPTGKDGFGLPTYTFPTCTDASLDALPAGAGWWKSYAFSDGFHPTPYGHQLLAQYVNLALAKKGWL